MKWAGERKTQAGCWSTGTLLLLALLALAASLACVISDVVRKGAEPIDRGGCVLDCRRAGLELARYVYEIDGCWCRLPDGGEVEAREFLGR